MVVLVVLKGVVVPCTVKSPWIRALPVAVIPTKVGLSPVCKPVSTSVLAPFIVALTVP